MSICTIFRKCQNCGHRYSYNPSVGKFGRFCPKCHKVQEWLVESSKNHSIDFAQKQKGCKEEE